MKKIFKGMFFVFLMNLCFYYVKADDELIRYVTVNVPSAPVVGAPIDGTYSVPDDENYQVVTWNDGKMFIHYKGDGSNQVTGKYQPGEEYYWSVVVCPKEGYALANNSDMNFTVKGVDVNDNTIVDHTERTTNSNCRGISIYFKKLPGVKKEFITTPESDIDHNIGTPYEISFSFSVDGEIVLQKNDNNSWVNLNTFSVAANEVRTYEIPSESTNKIIAYRLKYDNGELIKYSTFRINWIDPTKTLSEVTLNLPSRPYAGEDVINTFTIPEDANYEIATWNGGHLYVMVNGDGYTEVTGKYEPEIDYHWSAIVCPKEGYGFVNYSEMNFTVNGINVNDSNVVSRTERTVNGTNCRGLTIYFKRLAYPPMVKPTIKITPNNNKLTIEWEDQLIAKKYRLYESTDKKKWTRVLNSDENKYTAKSLKYGKTYYYRVKAYDGTKWSAYSDIVSKKIKPNKVENLTIKSAGSYNVKLKYDMVKATGYAVYYSTNNKDWTKAANVDGYDKLEYNVKKLKANKTYYFRVRAYKTVSGEKVYGKYSEIVSTKTAPVSPGLSLSINTSELVNINLTTSKGATYYKGNVSYLKDFSENIYNMLLNEEGTTMPVNGTTGKTMYVRFKACNAEDRCSAYTEASIKLTPKTPSLKLESTTTKKVTITVGYVSDADGYEVYRSTSKDGKYELIKSLTNIDLLTFDNKTKKDVTYYYKVRSYRVVNEKKVNSPYSKIKKIVSK